MTQKAYKEHLKRVAEHAKSEDVTMLQTPEECRTVLEEVERQIETFRKKIHQLRELMEDAEAQATALRQREIAILAGKADRGGRGE